MTPEQREAYLDRIGMPTIATPDSAFLSELQRRHLLTVPFENLDIHRGTAVHADAERSIEKIVERRRGGFCYELNSAFAELLTSLGFKVTLLSARVFNPSGELGEEFDHLALRVDLEEPWLADVGFGDSSRDPLRLHDTEIQSDGWNEFRIDRREGYHFLVRREGDAWRDVYRFALTPRRLEDFVPMCHFHQTSPSSPFTRKVVCSRATESGRITISNNSLIITDRDGKREQPLPDEESRNRALLEHFGIAL
jgi:N-hydroxyarylamine O-acetyltransferase